MLPAAVETSITLVHPICLLAGPEFDAQPLALLTAGEQLRAGQSEEGFVPVQREDGTRGYVPAVVCEPLAVSVRGEPQPVSVIQEVALYRSPTPGDQFTARWLVAPGETLRALGRDGQFIRVQRHNGQTGYLPATLCRGASPALPATVQVVQAISLYGSPSPGSQLETRWLVARGEPLLLLGRDGRFALVQREDGQLGYVPLALCGQGAGTDVLLRAGPVDLGWMTIGGIWGLVNWSGVALALDQSFFGDIALAPYLGLGVVLGVAALLWFASRRRLPARSFAIGVLLAYAFLHFSSGGLFTLWR